MFTIYVFISRVLLTGLFFFFTSNCRPCPDAFFSSFPFLLLLLFNPLSYTDTRSLLISHLYTMDTTPVTPTPAPTATHNPTPTTTAITSAQKKILRKRPAALLHHVVVPPINFAPVERNFFRSGQPAPINFPFLSQLHLRTILWLAVEDPSDALIAFADDNDIDVRHLGVVTEGSNPWDQLTERSIVAALDVVLDKSMHPVLVCCGMGRHRSGTVVGCLRRLQGWNLASISEEYRRFAGVRGGRVLIELHIEAFDTSSVAIDANKVPEWFHIEQ